MQFPNRKLNLRFHFTRNITNNKKFDFISNVSLFSLSKRRRSCLRELFQSFTHFFATRSFFFKSCRSYNTRWKDGRWKKWAEIKRRSFVSNFLFLKFTHSVEIIIFTIPPFFLLCVMFRFRRFKFSGAKTKFSILPRAHTISLDSK